MIMEFFVDRFDFFEDTIFLYFLQIEKVSEQLIIFQSEEVLHAHFGLFPFFLACIVQIKLIVKENI